MLRRSGFAEATDHDGDDSMGSGTADMMKAMFTGTPLHSILSFSSEELTYEDIQDTIRKLKEAGCVIALASSKPETACRRILEHFSLTPYFDEIVGSTLDGSISTKQQVLEELGRRMEHMQITKDEMCLIGDTEYDVIGADQFGIRCVGVSYGFGKRELLERAGVYCVCDNRAEIGRAHV